MSEEKEKRVQLRIDIPAKLKAEIDAEVSKRGQGHTINEVATERLSGKIPEPQSQPESKATQWPTDAKGNPLCIHDNKVIVIEYDNIHLGDEIALCKYKRLNLVQNFNPLENPDHLKICNQVCKLQSQNRDVAKLALERAKIDARTQAKFNLQAEIHKQPVPNTALPVGRSKAEKPYFDDCPVINGIKNHRGDCPNTRAYTNGGGSRGDWQPDRTGWKYG